MLLNDRVFCALIFFSALLLTAILRKYALHRKLLDIPNARSSHSVATPRGGGLSIVLCYFAALIWLYFGHRMSVDVFYGLSVSGIIVSAVGYWDDHKSISARIRLGAHFAAALWMIYWIGGVESITIFKLDIKLGLTGHLGSVVFLVWLLNLYNFMDGIDALAAMETIFVTLSIVFLIYLRGLPADYLTLLVFVLALSSMGFLVWNWPPAKIFMGDVGSGFVGFALAALAITASRDKTLSIWPWLILLGIFICDSTITLLRRFLRGEKWYEAHRSHAYQITSRLLRSHKKVGMLILMVNLFWLLPWAVVTVFYPDFGLLWLLIAYAPIIIVINRLAAVNV